MTDSLILVAFLIAIVFLSGALLAATPWFMKKNECFAVTIPESAQADVRFLAFRKRYAVAVLVVTLSARSRLPSFPASPSGRWVRQPAPLHRTQSSLRQSSWRQRCPRLYRLP